MNIASNDKNKEHDSKTFNENLCWLDTDHSSFQERLLLFAVSARENTFLLFL